MLQALATPLWVLLAILLGLALVGFFARVRRRAGRPVRRSALFLTRVVWIAVVVVAAREGGHRRQEKAVELMSEYAQAQRARDPALDRAATGDSALWPAHASTPDVRCPDTVPVSGDRFECWARFPSGRVLEADVDPSLERVFPFSEYRD